MGKHVEHHVSAWVVLILWATAPILENLKPGYADVQDRAARRNIVSATREVTLAAANGNAQIATTVQGLSPANNFDIITRLCVLYLKVDQVGQARIFIFTRTSEP